MKGQLALRNRPVDALGQTDEVYASLFQRSHLGDEVLRRVAEPVEALDDEDIAPTEFLHATLQLGPRLRGAGGRFLISALKRQQVLFYPGKGAWTLYMVHITETCDEEHAHLIIHVDMTEATVHEARWTEAINGQLAGKGLAPSEHLDDAAHVDADILLSSKEDHDIHLIGQARPDPSWQARTEGGYTAD
jgi:hypothetical protein